MSIVNCYSFSLGSKVFKSISFHVDKCNRSGNFVTLGLSSDFKKPERLDVIERFVRERLQDFGACLVTCEIESKSLDKKYSAICAIVNNIFGIKTLVNYLLKFDELYEKREKINFALSELKKGVYFSNDRFKQRIYEKVRPYIESIRSKTSNNRIAKEWVKYAARGFDVEDEDVSSLAKIYNLGLEDISKFPDDCLKWIVQKTILDAFDNSENLS